MSREATQDKPTQPRPTDAQGRELDEWNLPLSGPARARVLAELGKPDPNDDPEAWSVVVLQRQSGGQTVEALAGSSKKGASSANTEKSNG